MSETVAQAALWVLPVLFAVVLHEVAHGYAAWWLGDPTAAERGRLTLNPFAHVDPVGTVIVPLVLFLTKAGFLFGWAKPVPVDYSRLRRPRRDMVLVAAAGPMTNLTLALLAALVLEGLVLAAGSASEAVVRSVLRPLALMAQYAVLMNVFLGIFNLLPIPPLDGGRVLAGLLPAPWARQYARLEPFGMMIVVLLVMTGTLGLLVDAPVRTLLRVLMG